MLNLFKRFSRPTLDDLEEYWRLPDILLAAHFGDTPSFQPLDDYADALCRLLKRNPQQGISKFIEVLSAFYTEVIDMELVILHIKTNLLINALAQKNVLQRMLSSIDGKYAAVTLLMLHAAISRDPQARAFAQYARGLPPVAGIKTSQAGREKKEESYMNMAAQLLPPAWCELVAPSITTAEQLVNEIWFARTPLAIAIDKTQTATPVKENQPEHLPESLM